MITISAPTSKEKILLNIRASSDYVSQIEEGLKIFASDVSDADADANLTKMERQQKIDYLVKQFGDKYGSIADKADARLAGIEHSVAEYMSQGRYDDSQVVSALDAIKEHGDSLPESMIEQIIDDAKTQAGWARLVYAAMRKADVKGDAVFDIGEYCQMLDAVSGASMDGLRDSVWVAVRSPLTHRDMHEQLHALNVLEGNVNQLHG